MRRNVVRSSEIAGVQGSLIADENGYLFMSDGDYWLAHISYFEDWIGGSPAWSGGVTYRDVRNQIANGENIRMVVTHRARFEAVGDMFPIWWNSAVVRVANPPTA